MRFQSLTLVTASLAAIGLSTAPASAVEYLGLVTVTTTDGKVLPTESTITGRPNVIEAVAFSVAATHQTVTLPNGTTLVGPDSLSPFSFQARTGVASTTLELAAYQATPFKTVSIDILAYDTAGLATEGKTVGTWTFSDPYITRFTADGTPGFLFETYAFGAYSRAQYKFYSYDADANVRGTQSLDWQIVAPGKTYPTTFKAGTVPDFVRVDAFGDLAVAPGVAGPVNGFTVPEPATLAALAGAGLLIARRRR